MSLPAPEYVEPAGRFVVINDVQYKRTTAFRLGLIATEDEEVEAPSATKRVAGRAQSTAVGPNSAQSTALPAPEAAAAAGAVGQETAAQAAGEATPPVAVAGGPVGPGNPPVVTTTPEPATVSSKPRRNA